MLMDSLDTFIGLVTTFLILSLIVTAVGEGVSTWINLRGQVLRDSMVSLLGESTAQNVLSHEAVQRLHAPERIGPGLSARLARIRKQLPSWVPIPRQWLPSYIPDEVFAKVLVDLLVNPPPPPTASTKPITANTIDAALRISVAPYHKAVTNLWRESDYDPAEFEKGLAVWFNYTGDRSVGWFRRRLGVVLFCIGLVMAISLNADTIHMFKVLSGNAELRQQFVERAVEIVAKSDAEWENACTAGGTDLSPASLRICKAVATKLASGDYVESEILSTENKPFIERICEEKIGGDSIPDGCTQMASQLVERQMGACSAVGLERDCTAADLYRQALPELTPLLGLDLVATQLDALRDVNSGGLGILDGLTFWTLKLFGWFLTAAAVSFGAPFWFDLLQKMVQIRGSLKPSATSPTKESVKDRASDTSEPPAARSVVRGARVAAASLGNLTGFESSEFGYSAVNLFWSARLSKLTYNPERAVVQGQLEEWGAEGDLFADGDTQFIIAHTPKAAFVSFRGTESLADWLTNTQIDPKPPTWLANAGYKTHTGFHDALVSAFDNVILDALKEFGITARNLPIWVSGHSLGGALAALCTLRLSDAVGADPDTDNTIAALHTFGQPRVGDQACADALERVLPNRYFRSVNHRDIVPRVPPDSTPDLLDLIQERKSPMQVHQYRHAGRVVYFNDARVAMMDPPFWYRKLDVLWTGASEDEIREALGETTGDHDMAEYVHLHRSLLFAIAGEMVTA